LPRGVCSYLDGRAGSKFPDGANRPHEDGAEHLREAISIIGAQRIMYGSDTSAISTNYSILDNLRTAIEAQLSAEEREQIAWKTANQLYKLGLKG
jgi:predicted TIM-barrel fold metal-dependent hydrolase